MFERLEYRLHSSTFHRITPLHKYNGIFIRINITVENKIS